MTETLQPGCYCMQSFQVREIVRHHARACERSCVRDGERVVVIARL